MYDIWKCTVDNYIHAILLFARDAQTFRYIFAIASSSPVSFTSRSMFDRRGAHPRAKRGTRRQWREGSERGGRGGDGCDGGARTPGCVVPRVKIRSRDCTAASHCLAPSGQRPPPPRHPLPLPRADRSSGEIKFGISWNAHTRRRPATLAPSLPPTGRGRWG